MFLWYYRVIETNGRWSGHRQELVIVAYMKKGFKVIGTGLLAFGLAVSSPGISDVLEGNVSHSVDAASVKEFNKVGKLYASASRRSKVIQNVSKGTDVTVLEVKGSWTKVRIGSRTGWTAGRDLSSIVRVNAVTKTFNKSSVIRSSASTRAKVIKSVSKGTEVDVLEVKGSWSKVRVGSQVGWTAGRDLSSVVSVDVVTKTFNKSSVIRSSGSTRAKVILNVKAGTKASVLEVKGSWSKVKVGTVVGWTAGRDLSSGVVVEDKVIGTKMFMNSSALRASRSRGAKAVLFVKPGHVASLLEVNGSWSKVKVGTKVGWVASRDLVGMNFEYREVKRGSEMRIGVRSTDAVVGKVEVGDFVEYVRSSGSLIQVKKGTVVGWVPASVLSAEVLERGDADMVLSKLSKDGRFEYVPADGTRSEKYVMQFAETDSARLMKSTKGNLIVSHMIWDAYGKTSSNSEMRETLMAKQYESFGIIGEVLYGKGTAEAKEYERVLTGHMKKLEGMINADWHNRMKIAEEGTFKVNGDTYKYYYSGAFLDVVFV